MSEISRYIKPVEGFQYSVNIAYDIYDDKKIASYIPSNSSLQIIEDILASTENKSIDRARILTGAYGKGKSHLILYVMSLLAGRDPAIFETVIKKAEQTNENLAKNLREYISSGKKLLPVIINANSMDIKVTLLQSLSFALKQANLSNIMPTTFFDVAIDKILSWQKEFPDTYRLLEIKTGQAGDSLIEELREYNQSSYDLFVKVYPSLTSGSEFNPLVGSDVIGVYDSVIKALKPFGYHGIFVVYDEFGKFLEGSVDKSSAMDIKLIQDFGERCCRSGSEQLHIMLISHKSIENYIGRLSKAKVDAWKAVSARFKSISINNDEIEIYDMISTILAKNEHFADYVGRNESHFSILNNVVNNGHSFADARKAVVGDLAIKCYPLHPYSLLLLPRVSELVAQNERTIFTFLSSSERYTVPYFIRTELSDFPLIEPDYIYDYFEKLFKGEPFGSDVKKQWQITTAAIAKIKEYDNLLAEKIVKTLALIYCVNDFEIIPPSWDIISNIYSVNYSIAEIESAKEILKRCHVLIELLYKPFVRITEGSRHDVLDMIQQEKYAVERRLSAKDILNDVSDVKYLYPVQYNDENEIIRYFDFRFVDVQDIDKIAARGYALDTKADGVVYAVLIGSESELDLAKEKVEHIENKRALFVLPKQFTNIQNVCLEYKAICNLIELYNDREVELLNELNFILEDREALLKSFIDGTYIQLEKKQAEIYYASEKIAVGRKAQLSALLSQIVSTIYYRTPQIVNELINKNELSGAIKNARNKLISAILAGNYKKNLGIVGNGPELNILRSMLVIPGIFIDSDEETRLDYSCNDEKVRSVLEEIKRFALNATDEKEGNMALLYDKLIQPEFGFGLKLGVIPIYLAIVLVQFKEHLSIVKKGHELPLTATVVSEIEQNPKDYALLLEKWDESKDAYLATLESIFSEYINQVDKGSSSFIFIVKAMRRWYLQLTKFESTSKLYCADDGQVIRFNPETLKFRSSLGNPEINAHEYLFETLPVIYGKKNLSELVQGIRTSFNMLSTSYAHYHSKYIVAIKHLFKGQNKERLSSVLSNYYDDLKSSTKEHLFSGQIGLVLNILKCPHNDENKLVEDIAKALFNLRMNDFTDEIMASYLSELTIVKEAIDKYDSEVHNQMADGKGYKIVFADRDGQETTRQFDSVDETPIGQLLYNDVTSILEEFGESLSSDEKRQILFKILKDLV